MSYDSILLWKEGGGGVKTKKKKVVDFIDIKSFLKEEIKQFIQIF